MDLASLAFRLKLKTFAVFILLLFNFACTRKGNDQSLVTITVPKQSDLEKSGSSVSALLFAGKKICFAVNVLGDGIPQVAECGQNIGTFAGFVAEGGVVTVDITRGRNRSFALLASLVDPNSPCPSASDIKNSKSLWGNIYSAGSVANITLDSQEKTIEIPVTMETNSLGAISGIAECGGQAGVIRAALLSSGIIVDGNLNRLTIDSSLPIWESITYGLGVVSGFEWYFLTGSNSVAIRPEANLFPNFSTTNVFPYVRSLTQRPGTREFYGLLENGQIVSVEPTSGQPSEISSCPIDTCQVPVWVQSISIGNNQKVFALDHAGNVYQVTKPGIEPVMTYVRSVSPIVSQLVIY